MQESTVVIIQSVLLGIITIYFILAIVTRYARRKRLQNLLNDAVITDGAHHKQWYLWEIAKELGITPATEDKGIAP